MHMVHDGDIESVHMIAVCLLHGEGGCGPL